MAMDTASKKKNSAVLASEKARLGSRRKIAGARQFREAVRNVVAARRVSGYLHVPRMLAVVGGETHLVRAIINGRVIGGQLSRCTLPPASESRRDVREIALRERSRLSSASASISLSFS